MNPFEGCTPEVPEGEKLDFGSQHFRELERAGIAAAGVCVACGLGLVCTRSAPGSHDWLLIWLLMEQARCVAAAISATNCVNVWPTSLLLRNLSIHPQATPRLCW